MWRFIITTFLILLLAVPAYPRTVDESGQRALTHNPDLQTLRLEEDAAGGGLEKVRLLLINNPTIEGSHSEKDMPAEEGVGMSIIGNGSHPLVPVVSPVGGRVIEKAVIQGGVVNSEKAQRILFISRRNSYVCR